MRRAIAALFVALPLAVGAQDPHAGPLPAERETVCTITVNSTDERDVFRRELPEDRYRFVELVEHGRPDWLASACRAKVRCDVLVVSGHFAGSEFYSSKPTIDETLKVDEMERAICTQSCPEVFSHLKEVYLFGCDTLKPDAVKSATPELVRAWVADGEPAPDAERDARALSERYGESSRDLMRRLFAHVPVIYGFASLAPLGRVSGPMLEHYFRSGPEVAVGSGRVSAGLLRLFAPSSMVVTSGQADDEPYAAYRRETCRYYDARQSLAERIGSVHEVLAGDATALRMSFDRVEAFFGAIDAAARARDGTAQAMRTLASDAPAASRYLALTRHTRDPALRLRMVALARDVGWLDAQGERAEQRSLVRDVVSDPSMAYGEVELVCGLNAGHALDGALDGSPPLRTLSLAQAAGVACLGSPEARTRVLKALASPHEAEVQVAQAYLRHRPIEDANELRGLAIDVSRMRSIPAQVRALDTLGRHHIADRDVIEQLSKLFGSTRSLEVQRAIAEIFLRTGPEVLDTRVAATLRGARIRPPGGEPDLIDQLLRRLSS
ncbi:MAG TPA: hypothetical protein VFE23_10145 [Usitatibacter sp.]|nr:hypothetical protein [Usitatibacter sp.]